MTKKMFRKLLMISAILLMLSSQANADYCSDEYDACCSVGPLLYYMCLNIDIPCNFYCFYGCISNGYALQYCHTSCEWYCPETEFPYEECMTVVWQNIIDCGEAYDECMDN